MRVLIGLSLVIIILFYASFARAQEPKGLENLQSGVFGAERGELLTSEFTKIDGFDLYTKSGFSGVEYGFSPINEFCMAGKKITYGEAIALVKQFTNKYGSPQIDTPGISMVGKVHNWTLSNLVPFNFNGEIHPTDVGITVTTGGSKSGPRLMIMNPEIFRWGVYQKKTR